MKCTRCREAAVIDLRRHNAAFCVPCFTRFAHTQVQRTIDDHRMFAQSDRVLVAVSGGKDSLALWAILRELGYSADGLYIGLGIGEYSDASLEFTQRFADARGWPLQVVDVPSVYNFDIPGAAVATKRAPCGACGLSKRHLFDQAATEGGYDAVATGHNLDDEAAVLLGNVLRWEIEPMSRQSPVLEAHDGFPRKVKPLVRLSERETAAYCVISGIDYLVDECPMSVGNKHIGYKEMLNTLELQSPGAKTAFLGHFYERGRAALQVPEREPRELRACATCGGPTNSEICQFCRMREKADGVTSTPLIARKSNKRRKSRRSATAAPESTGTP